MEGEIEATVRVELSTGRKFNLQLAATPFATCADIIESVKHCVIELEFSTDNSKWMLLEIWRGLEKKIPIHSNFMSVVNSWNGLDQISFVIREKRIGKKIKKTPSRGSKDKMTKKLLRELSRKKKELRQLRLLRIRTDLTGDPFKQGLQLITRLSDKHDSLRAKKELLSSQVFEMNHQATRMTEQLTILRRTAQAYNDSLTQLRDEGSRTRQGIVSEKEEKLRHLNEAVSSVNSELEIKQRMSELQNNKISVMQNELSNLHMTLYAKETELEQMKDLSIERKSLQDVPTQSSEVLSRTADIKRDRDGGDSFKRKFMNMNKKTKQQAKEEARVFKEALKTQKGPDQHEIDQSLLEATDGIGNTDTLGHQKRRSSKDKKTILRKEGSKRSKPFIKKKVNFGAEALILDAAGEGDLNLVKQCINELGSYQVCSTKGATCLHNAVCSGNLSVMEYFISLGYDVNSQDLEGWTPLHCAVGFTHLPAVHLLINSGASLYLRTEENLTPLDLAQEASTDDDSDIDALNCYHYLMDCISGLGKINDRKLYALFDYTATNPEELTFINGEMLTILQRGSDDEGWWKAENVEGIVGYVPSTFLGLYPQRQIVL